MYSIRCAPAPDGVPVDPCGTVGGVALSPVLVAEEPFNGSSGVELFSYGFGLVGGLFVVGFVIGSIIRVIRSA